MLVEAGAVAVGICMINCCRVLPLSMTDRNISHRYDLHSKKKGHLLWPPCNFKYESSHAATWTQSQVQDILWANLKEEITSMTMNKARKERLEDDSSSSSFPVSVIADTVGLVRRDLLP